PSFFSLPRPTPPTLCPHTTLRRSEGHAARFEDAPLRAPKRPALAFEHEPPANVLVAEHQVTALEGADVIERRLANGGITGHGIRSEEHTSELQSRENLVCRLLLEK